MTTSLFDGSDTRDPSSNSNVANEDASVAKAAPSSSDCPTDTGESAPTDVPARTRPRTEISFAFAGLNFSTLRGIFRILPTGIAWGLAIRFSCCTIL
jgi:hypothetical protein